MRASDAETAAVAFITCLTVCPVVGAACQRFAILDHPGPLKIHKRPIPRLGGIAIAVAVSVAMLVAGRFEIQPSLTAAAFALVWFTGLLDDVRPLTPSARLISQIVAAFLLWRAGYAFPNVIGELPSLIGTIIVIIVLTNSWNFVDGSDGLAAGVAAIAALAFFVAPGQAQSSMGAPLAVSVAAACAGFLIWNFPPAKIFMGDAGSTLLGFAIALFTLDFYRSNSASLPVALFPVSVAALPLLDAVLAIVRRFRQAQSLVRGDRDHSYDVLLARGWRPRNVALAFFVLTAVLSGVGWLAVFTKRTMFLLPGAIVMAGVTATAILLGTLGGSAKTAEHERSAPEVISSRSAS